MQKLDFCPECGGKLSTGNEFCPNCGYDLRSILKTNDQESSTEDKVSHQQISNNKAANKSNNSNRRKNRFIWILLAVFAIIVAGGYFTGNWYYSKDRQVQALSDASTSGSNAKMQSVLVDSSKKKLSSEKINALKRLYLKDGSAVKDIAIQIESRGGKRAFEVIENGKYFLLFPKYSVEVLDKNIEIKTNIDNPSFFFDGKSVATTLSNGEYKLTGLTPGIYDLKIKGSKKTKEKIVEILPVSSSTEISLNVKESKAKTPKKSTSTQKSNLNDDTEILSNKRTSDDSGDEENNSSNSLVGTYSGNPDLSLNADGTYSLGSKSGTYDVLQNDNGQVQIKFNQDGGGSIVESYDYSDGVLHSSKYDADWVKD